MANSRICYNMARLTDAEVECYASLVCLMVVFQFGIKNSCVVMQG